MEQNTRMSGPSPWSVDPGQASTPLVPNKHVIRPRVLTKEETTAQPRCSGDWSEWRDLERPGWDKFESPQFVDFLNIPEPRHSFFDQPIIASTPKGNTCQMAGGYETEDETLIKYSSLDNISIATIIANDDAGNKSYTISLGCKENVEPHVTVQKQDNKVVPVPLKSDNRQKQLPVRIATKPKATIEVREKPKAAIKEETQWKGFKAKPAPKFVKERLQLATKKTKEQSAHSSEKDINANERTKRPNTFQGFAAPKPPKELLPSTSNKPPCLQRQRESENRPKKSVEIWKKKPFVPEKSQKPVDRPRSPRLSTADRAKERRRFDEILKEKEKEQERRKEMEELARKKKEEEEIAQLRLMTVHKAQPIRQYKSTLPFIKKRPLTDPIGPSLLKRARYK